MTRKPPEIIIPASDREILIRWSNSRTLAYQTVERAKMILACGEGKPVKFIAKELKTYPNKIIYWRNRYIEIGLDGLLDKPRSGRPAKYDKAFRDKILKLIGTKPPKGYATWDGPLLAKELDVPADAVWSILRKEGYSLTTSSMND